MKVQVVKMSLKKFFEGINKLLQLNSKRLAWKSAERSDCDKNIKALTSGILLLLLPPPVWVLNICRFIVSLFVFPSTLNNQTY